MADTTIITGRVGGNPEMRYTPDGKAVANFSVAVNQGKDRPAKWFSVACWERLAEVCNEYVVKGMVVEVIGTIRAQAYIDQRGEARASLQLTARNVEFHSSSKNGDGGNDTGEDEEFAPPPRDMSDVPF